MTRKMIFLMAILALPFAIYAQNDDMYFVSSKKKSANKEKTVENKSSARRSASPWADVEDADFHTGKLRDVDEYNRRGNRQVIARLDGDTLYVHSPDSLEQKEYLVRYEENYAVDDPYIDDYYYSARLSRYHGFYHFDPFMWDICYGWYDPWYDPWYGWYGPYYRHGWYSWSTWGWGWGHCHLGWHHGWGPGWHHGWAPAAPPRPMRPGGSALANGGRRPGAGTGSVSASRGGRNYASASRSGSVSSRTNRGSGGVVGSQPSRSQSGVRYNAPSRGSRSSSTYSTPSNNRSSSTYSAPSRSTRSSGGSFSGGSSGGSRGGGFSGGGGGGGRRGR